MSASIPVGQDPSFPISGSVQGLAPGVRSRLALTISNPFKFPIRIIQLTVAVGDPAGACEGTDLDIDPFRTPFQVPARGRATTYLGVTLSRGTPDVCQAATWRLSYRGQAVMVKGSGGGTSSPTAKPETASPGAASPGAASPEASGTGLPVTGLALSLLITVAAVLLAGGATILLVLRRRPPAARPTQDSGSP